MATTNVRTEINGIEIPNAEVGRLLFKAHQIISQQDRKRYGVALVGLLRTAFHQSPADHPIRVVILKRSAKIARELGKYNLSKLLLNQAWDIARKTLGLGHRETLRILEKLVKLQEVQRSWTTDGELIPKHKRLPIDQLVDQVRTVYERPMRKAHAQSLLGIAKLLEADMHFCLGGVIGQEGNCEEEFERAVKLYDEAAKLLPADDSNQKRLQQYRMAASEGHNYVPRS